MGKVVKFPIQTPEKFGPERVRVKKAEAVEKHGQLNLFAGARIVRLHKLSNFEEALLLDDQGDIDAAIKHYLEAVRNGDALGDSYCNLGILEWQKGHQVKAVDYFTLALQHDPRHFEAHYNLANLYGELGNFPLAKAHYRISIELEPSFPNSHFNLALTFAMNKEFDEAVKCLMRYRELSTPADHQIADDLILKLSNAR